MPSVTRTELLRIHTDLTAKAREIMTAKNKDYANELDVFRNFRRYGTLGVLVRLSDKLARLDSFEENKTFAVADEKLVDTIIDLVNYAVIYYAMKQETDPTTTAPAIQMGPGKVLAGKILPIPVQSGPKCGNCGNLADFEDPGFAPQFWCSDCACRRGVDTSDMYMLESVA